MVISCDIIPWVYGPRGKDTGGDLLAGRPILYAWFLRTQTNTQMKSGTHTKKNLNIGGLYKAYNGSNAAHEDKWNPKRKINDLSI